MSAGDWKDMFQACTSGDLDLVEFYLRKGVDPNHQHPEFLTSPLIESVRTKHIEIVQLLLAHGADPNLPEDCGSDTPISVAESFNDKRFLEALTG